MIDQNYPLTSTQKAIWLTDRLFPDAVLYNVAGYAVINGDIDARLFEEAIRQMVAGNDIFRLVFEEGEAGTVQSFEESPKYQLKVLSREGEEACVDWMETDSEKPLDLDGQLFETALLKAKADQYFWYVKIHHLIADGYTLALIFNSVARHYTALVHSTGSEAQPVEFRFDRLIQEHIAYSQSSAFEVDRKFWLDRFEGFDQVSTKENQIAKPATTRRRKRTLPRDLANRIQQFSAENGITLYHYFIGVLATFYFRVFQRTELVLGLPLLNRTGRAYKQTFGPFLEVLPLRIQLTPDGCFRELLKEIKSEFQECFRHHKFVAFDLMQDLESRSPLYEVMFSYQRALYQPQFNGADVEIQYLKAKDQLEDLVIHLTEYNENWDLELIIDGKADLYAEWELDAFLDILFHLAEEGMISAANPVTTLRLSANSSEQNPAAEWTHTESTDPPHGTLPELISERVASGQTLPAIHTLAQVLTYGEMEEQACRLAGSLQKSGLQNGDCVGIVAHCEAESLNAILAIWKAGGVFVPIDPNAPQARTSFIVEESKIQVILIPEAYWEQHQYLEAQVSNLITLPANLEFPNETPMEQAAFPDPDDAAYILYTSGTTGNPKGVVVSHRSICQYSWWAATEYADQLPLRFGVFTPFFFDLTLTSLFVPLITGGTAVFLDSDVYQLANLIRTSNVDLLKVTPSHLELIRHENCAESSLSRLIVGGEAFPMDLARQIDENFEGKVRIFNEYGPTEATVGCMIHEFDPREAWDTTVPIGGPGGNREISLLDAQMQPVPIGVPGEIYIGGAGLADGYQENAPLTETHFLLHPFRAGERVYKSGDEARRLPTGALQFLGRVDRQVKVRGYRIEPEAIENVLRTYAGIEHVVVVPYTDSVGHLHLWAFFVANRQIVEEDLVAWMHTHLQSYQVPTHVKQIPALPLTANGKLNTQALPFDPSPSEESFAPPVNEVEESLIRIWEAVLGHEGLGTRANFFRLGGDSIKAVQIASRLKEEGLILAPHQLLTAETIGRVSGLVTRDQPTVIYQQSPLEGERTLTPIETWFLEQNLPEPGYFNQSVLLNCPQKLETNLLEKSLQILILHHDGLRQNLDATRNRIFFNAQHLDKSFQLSFFDLTGQVEPEVEFERLAATLQQGFDLGQELLFRAGYIRFKDQPDRLLLVAHHLLVDGVSWRILLEDLARCYHNLASGIEPGLPARTASLRDWTEAITQLVAQPPDQDTVSYWSQLEPFLSTHSRALKSPISLVENETVAICELEPGLTSVLLQKAQEVYRTDPAVLMISALLQTLKELTQRTTFLFELENHGRHVKALDTSRTVGWFTTLYPVRLEAIGEVSQTQITAVKEQLNQVPEKGMGYGLYKYLGSQNASRSPHFPEVRFNYLGQFGAESKNDLFEYTGKRFGQDMSPQNPMTTALEVNAFIFSDTLSIEMRYDGRAFLPHSVAEIQEQFLARLTASIDHLTEAGTVFLSPSDFETVTMSQEELDNLFDL